MKANGSQSLRSVVFVEQFFFPEGWGGAQLPRDITKHLVKAGRKVVVVCGSDMYVPIHATENEDPRSSGVSIKRVSRLIRGRVHSFKWLRQMWFYLGALPLVILRKSPGVFVSQTNPPLIIPLVALAAKLHRRPLVVIAQDLYPEVIFAHGMMRKDSLSGKVLTKLFRWAYSSARLVVALGPVMKNRLVEKGVNANRIRVISNWATGDVEVVRGAGNILRREWGLDGKFVILYSGSVGLSHDYETPILAIREVALEIPQVRMVFVGGGSRWEDAKKFAVKHRLESHVQFHPFVAPELLPHSIGLADAALVTMKDGFQGLVVPSKLLGYMARGISTIYVGPQSDIQDLIDQAGGGLCVDNGDVSGLARKILELHLDKSKLATFSARSLTYYHTHLSQHIALQRYGRLFSELDG